MAHYLYEKIYTKTSIYDRHVVARSIRMINEKRGKIKIEKLNLAEY